MSSITDKIDYLKETKELFKQWIVNQQGNVTNNTSFREYVDIIDAILTRGPIKPIKWIKVNDLSATNKGKFRLKFEDPGLYFWSNNSFLSETSYSTIITLTTVDNTNYSLVLKKISENFVLYWRSGSELIPVPDDADYTIIIDSSNSYGTTYLITIAEGSSIYLDISEEVVSASGDADIVYYVYIEQAE